MGGGNLLIYQARESNLVPAKFLTACLDEWESAEKLGRMDVSSLFSRKAMKRTTTLFSPSKQRLHKSQFLQELSCQTPYWDQVRLSSLVNKQVAVNALGMGKPSK